MIARRGHAVVRAHSGAVVRRVSVALVDTRAWITMRRRLSDATVGRQAPGGKLPLGPSKGRGERRGTSSPVGRPDPAINVAARDARIQSVIRVGQMDGCRGSSRRHYGSRLYRAAARKHVLGHPSTRA